MSFTQRLQSALILNTHLHHPSEAHIVEHPHQHMYDAIRSGSEEEVLKLLLGGYDVDYHECGHAPALIFALLQRHYHIVQMLLEHGASANVSNPNGQSALAIACAQNQTEIVHLLLRYGATADVSLHAGLKADGAHALLELIRETPAMPVEGGSAFLNAKKGRLREIVYALENGIDLFTHDHRGNTMLHHAVYNGSIRLCCYLLNKGIDIDTVNHAGETVLMLAMRHHAPIELIRFLLRRGATADHGCNKGHCALTIGLRSQYSEAVALLLHSGVNIHVCDGIHTPLTLCHDVIAEGGPESKTFRKIETELLIRGAHVDVPTNDLRWTPLMHACTRHQDQVIREHMELLIRLGADVNATDTNGRTALMLAASMGRMEALKLLLKNYADLERIDHFGWNALILAVYYKHVEIVVELLEYGAEVNTVSIKGLNALKIARQNQHELLVDLLISFGAVDTENYQED